MKGQLVPDIVKFHALANSTLTKPDPASSHMVLVSDPSGTALKRKRVVGHIRLRKANLETFNNAIELALLQKQKRIFKCLRTYYETCKYMKFKLQMNCKARLFEALARKVKKNSIVKAYRSGIDQRTKAVIFYSLLNFKIKQYLMASMRKCITDQRNAKTRRVYFQEWHQLYSYFSRFTSSQNATYFTLKKSERHFILKYWLRLKTHTENRKLKQFRLQ